MRKEEGKGRRVGRKGRRNIPVYKDWSNGWKEMRLKNKGGRMGRKDNTENGV